MNAQQAKEILMLYRPGSADSNDPSFADALQLCESDPELKRWFDDHCATYLQLRTKFKQVPIPEGLKEQILAERKVHLVPMWRQPALVAAAAVAVIVLSAILLFRQMPRQTADFQSFRVRMVSTALRNYGMEVATDDLDRIQQFFEQRRAATGYTVPEGLRDKARATGCALLSWQGHPVSMLCFKSGRPLPAAQPNDLWLLIIDRDAMKEAPGAGAPVMAEVNGAATASWSDGKRVYVLVADGDEKFLKGYL